MEELEDAVTFLESARSIYPDVTLLLNTVQLLALDMHPNEPFSSERVNEEFVRLTEAFFSTKFNVDQTKNALRLALMEPHTKNKEIDVEDERKVIQCLEKVTPYSIVDFCKGRSRPVSHSQALTLC